MLTQASVLIVRRVLTQIITIPLPPKKHLFLIFSCSANSIWEYCVCAWIIAAFVLLVIGFVALLDNYESETGQQEVVTQHEVKENQVFIDVIMETEPMKIAHEYLAKKGLMPHDRAQFKRALYSLWFQMYRRTRGVRWYILVPWSFCASVHPPFSNWLWLLIHGVKTKKSTKVKEVWIPVLISIGFDNFTSPFTP